jgi:hypothetical protein
MDQLTENIEQVAALCNKYHVKTLRVFGSVARGESHAKSDIDLLATFSQPISLLQMVGLERELSALVGRRVDLVTKQSVSPYLRTRILKESRPIYAAR